MSCSSEEYLRKLSIKDLRVGHYSMFLTGDGFCNIFAKDGEIVPGERALALFGEIYGVDVPKEVELSCEPDDCIFYTSVSFDGEEVEGPDFIERDGVKYDVISWILEQCFIPFDYPIEPGMSVAYTITTDKISTYRWN